MESRFNQRGIFLQGAISSVRFVTFPGSLVEEGPMAHQRRFALLIFHSKHLMFDSSTGPFQAVRLIFFPDDEWQLDSPIYRKANIQFARIESPSSRNN